MNALKSVARTQMVKLKEGYTHIFHEIIEHSLHWSPACKNTAFAILSNSQTM